MDILLKLLAVVLGGLGATTFVAPPVTSDGGTGASAPSEASFEGRTIDLSRDWGPAKACLVSATETRCYRSEGEMDARATDLTADGLLANCTSSLRLYRSASYGGGVLALVARNVAHNLSTYGFNNDTSSYRVGTCRANLYDGGLGVGLYPGTTTAGATSPQMVAGWDNRVSTVYIL